MSILEYRVDRQGGRYGSSAKHGERHGRMGFDNDFTTEQSQRFTEVANSAVKRRVKKT